MDSTLKGMIKSISYLSCLTVLGFCLLCFFNFSCTQNNICLEPLTVALRGGFYHKDTANKNVDTALINANLRFGTNLSYFSNLKQARKFGFPLSQVNDTSTILFQSDSTDTDPATLDTITLIYLRELRFISVGCGYQTNYNLQQALTTRNIIDSVLINTNLVSNDASKEHLKIVIKN